jgi:glycine oxidase
MAISRFDCLVIGGGAVGLACALSLRARGRSVAVVERGPLGGAASSAAGGILAPQCEAHGPGPMLELCLRSRSLWPAFAARLEAESGVDVAYLADGTVGLAVDETEAAALARRIEWQRAAGLAVEPLAVAGLRALEPALGEAVLAARFPGDHQVDNLRVVRALAEAVRRAGVAVLAAEALALAERGGRIVGVELTTGVEPADEVVLAGGSWSALVGGGLPRHTVEPVRGQMLELAFAPPIRHVVFGDGGYLVPRRDGRLLCGSTEERVGFELAVTDEGQARLRRRLARLCPGLAGVATARSWSGLRPGTPDGLPLLGPAAIPGLHVATGHYRNGILLLPITAAIVAASVSGGPMPLPLEPFSPTRFSG